MLVHRTDADAVVIVLRLMVALGWAARDQSLVDGTGAG
jgi:hypothetical protein